MSIGGSPATPGSVPLNQNDVEVAKWKSSANATPQDITTIKLNGTTIWTKPSFSISGSASWNRNNNKATINATVAANATSWTYQIGSGSQVTGSGTSVEVTDTSNGSKTVTLRSFKGNTQKASATTSYAVAVPTISHTLSSGIGTITINVSASNHISSDKWQYKIGSGSWQTGAAIGTTSKTISSTAGTKSVTVRLLSSTGVVFATTSAKSVTVTVYTLSGSVATSSNTTTVNTPARTWPGNVHNNVGIALAPDGGYSPGDPLVIRVLNYISRNGRSTHINDYSNVNMQSGYSGAGLIGNIQISHNAYGITGGRGSVTTLGPWAYDLTGNGPNGYYIAAGVGAQSIPGGRNPTTPGIDGIMSVSLSGTRTVTVHTLTVATTGISTWKWQQGSGTLSSAINASTKTATVPAASGITIRGYNASGTEVISSTI